MLTAFVLCGFVSCSPWAIVPPMMLLSALFKINRTMAKAAQDEKAQKQAKRVTAEKKNK